jgi:histidyl-tRNA synthetase
MKPSIPKGTRDFLPQEVNRRNYIFDTIRAAFVRYGYQAIETPAMENLSTLMGKYGEEGDRLLFKVLNNGDFLGKADKDALAREDSYALVPSISKRGLRYDLTVPFARYVVMHQHELSFPFKRYAISPVWRADRPQKGRYQEFYQCDADIVGSDSLSYEAELIQIYDEVFHSLGIKTVIRLNNRKILAGVAEVAGIPNQMVDMTVAIDKLDKIGMEGVRKELTERGIPDEAIATIERILNVTDRQELRTALAGSATGTAGLDEIDTVYTYLEGYSLHNVLQFDITLARGLSYYTGCIFEVNADANAYPKLRMGSIGGGGRYADLTGMFGMKNMPGVGVSFGAERIYDVMDQCDLFPAEDEAALKVLLIAFDEASHRYAFRSLHQLRQAGINADLYPEPTKLKKQMKYANDRQVPYVILIGEHEMASGELTLKDMRSGEQAGHPLATIIDTLR